MTYIVCKAFKKKGISGDFSISRGTSIEVTSTGYLTHGERLICAISSQNAYDYVASNDDGNGRNRFNLSHSIIADIAELSASAQHAASEIASSIPEGEEPTEEQAAAIDACYANYKEAIAYINEHYPKFIRANGSWSFDFYNAAINELSDVSAKVKSLK